MNSEKREKGKEASVTIACAQIEPKIGFLQENREKSIKMIINASKRYKANFIVLPELCNSGYTFNSRKEAQGLAEAIPEGETIKVWEEIAKESVLYIVAGVAEKEGNKLFNSAILIGPDGYVGKYRKLHLWYEEKLFFEPGNLGIPVFETQVGRVGLQICYDQWFPEVTRILALQGADIIAGPTNWVPINKSEHPDLLIMNKRMPLANHIAIVNAHLNTLWTAYCSRVGVERGQPFIGSSIICAPGGAIVAGPASPKKEELLIARDCNLMASRTRKCWSELNVIPSDRRTDVYDLMLGYTGAKPHPF